ncbi:MAG TPA: hypothetical protein VHE58_08855 [Burkholderiales bacterium]|nr:hypothetical protein [Burkholderiales bacterium]
MKFLDELKKEAEERKQQEALETQSKLSALGQNFMQLQAKLREIYAYLDDLVKQLNVVKPIVLRSYYIEGLGNFEGLNQKEYALNKTHKSIDNKDFIDTITLRLKCTAEGALSMEKDTPGLIKTMCEYLRDFKIKFELQEMKNQRGFVDRAVFKVPREVPVTVAFNGNLEKSTIKIQVKNLERLGESTFTYGIDEIDEQLLDEFSKLLVGKPNHFRQLGKHQSTVRTPLSKTSILDTQYKIEQEPEAKKSLLGSIKNKFFS